MSGARKLSCFIAMDRTFKQVNDTERSLLKNMIKDITWAKIQKITGRSPDTLRSIVKSKIGSAKKRGAAKRIPVKALPKVFQATERLQKKAKAENEITADMIIKEAGLKACRRTLQNTFHKNKIWFYNLKKEACIDSRRHRHAFCMGWKSHVNQK